MVCADRIAVMNKGRIDQVGTGFEIYEQPRTRFVASFIGRSNALPGRLVQPGVVEAAATTLHAIDASGTAAGLPVCVCVRPHRVSLGVVPEGPSNKLRGRIARATYLGESSDTLVELMDGSFIRAFVPPEAQHRPGENVDVYLPVRDCRVVAE